MEDILYDCGNAKRTDFRLKTRYYGIKTNIYLVEKRHYVIQLLNYLDVFDVIREDFNDNIRSLGDWIDLTSQKPEKILAIVEPISDIVCNNEGVFLTREMFQSLLISRFPKVNFVKILIEHKDGPNVIISVGKDTKDADIEAIGKFVRELKNGLKTIIVKRDLLVGEPLYNKSVELACTDRSFPFSIRDSEFWFDNVEKIYSGKIGKESLRFFDGSKTKCYMDFSVWNNDNINIRSNALLYDTIFLSFPLENHIEDFLQQQHLKIDDLEEMVARNKLVILLPNTENRYDKKIVDRLYQINHDAVVSKRGINTLMAMFYCELEERFLAYWQGNEQFFEALCSESIKRSDEKMKLIYERLVWPIKAMRESYELLTNYGPMKLASIGVNRLFEGMWQGNNKNDNNIQFELTVNSNAIHVASALQATYFPFANREEGGIYSDVTPSNILGDIINTYQYPYDEQRHNIMEYGRMLDRERESIYLLKSDNSISLKNMLNYAEKYSTATTLKKILMNLSGLDAEQRNDKIAEYNNLIAEIGEEKIKDKIFSYVLTAAGFIPVIGNITSCIEQIIRSYGDLGLKRKHSIKKIEAGIATKDDEVYILDKLSRVAKISID